MEHLREPVSEHTKLLVSLKSKILEKKSKYQEILIADLIEYGKALVLDNLIQLSESDEAYYHESLVHPAMFSLPKPEKVLILGGGDGCAAREALKHNPNEIVLVDIDEDVVNLSKIYLKELNELALENPKVKVVIEDGKKFVNETNMNFDCIIIDLTDPFGSQIGRELYSKDFYESIKKILKEDGVMVTQTGTAFYYEEVFNYVFENVRNVFKIVRFYNTWIPSFGYACCFIIASQIIDPLKISRGIIEERIKERKVKTKFYSVDVHEALFKIPLVKRLNKS